jgi:protein-tyrosine phosphatase
LLPLVDIHCHLLAGLDDGPKDSAEAIAMCRLAWEEGIRCISALAHQNDNYPANTPDRIRDGARALAQELQAQQVPLLAFPSAEIMVYPELEDDWRNGKLLSVADGRKYLLLELPHGLWLDLEPLAARLRAAGLTPILAHPERQPEFLHEDGPIERLIAAGCLVQVSSGSLTEPRSPADLAALKSWVKRGVVHFLASDGHTPRRRAPRLRQAYEVVRGWAGPLTADRLCSTNGLAVVQGLPLTVPVPEPRRSMWAIKFW